MIGVRIGITERGDASIDYGWEEKLNTVDGAVLITKNVTDEFISRTLPVKDKVILHATITGFGGSVLEPNVMPAEMSMEQLKALMELGFPATHIVVRVDPIIPTARGLGKAKKVIAMGADIGITRFRISVLDMYLHVKERFRNAGLDYPYGSRFSATDRQMADVDVMLKNVLAEFPSISIECCAEPRLKVPKHTGCIGPKDFALLGLNAPREETGRKQRAECLCSSCKTELLTNKCRCPNGCLYCYWVDK